MRDRVGRFQLADRGALFLDEVGEIPLALQGKLLRVLELQHVIERAVILARDGRFRLDLALPRRHMGSESAPDRPAPVVAPRSSAVVPDAEVRRRERENVLAALEQTHWKVYGPGGAAELLGIKATTLASRMRALGIRRPA